jgi:hypothetical protein
MVFWIWALVLHWAKFHSCPLVPWSPHMLIINFFGAEGTASWACLAWVQSPIYTHKTKKSKKSNKFSFSTLI